MSKSTHADSQILSNDNSNVRTSSAATDWYVKVNIHDETTWEITPYERILAGKGSIEKEPQTVPAKSTGSGGKFDAPFGPFGVSALISYNSPDPNWRFAWSFVIPYVGPNSCKARIIDKDTQIDQSLFDSMDDSSVTATSQDMTVDGKKYTFTISCSIGGGNTPTAEFYVSFVAA